MKIDKLYTIQIKTAAFASVTHLVTRRRDVSDVFGNAIPSGSVQAFEETDRFDRVFSDSCDGCAGDGFDAMESGPCPRCNGGGAYVRGLEGLNLAPDPVFDLAGDGLEDSAGIVGGLV